MNWYFITLVILNLLGLGIALEQHGTTEVRRNNFFVSLFTTALGVFLTVMAIRQGF